MTRIASLAYGGDCLAYPRERREAQRYQAEKALALARTILREEWLAVPAMIRAPAPILDARTAYNRGLLTEAEYLILALCPY